MLIGNCDGVHRGHQALIGRLCALARQHDAVPTLLTFHPHPRRFLHQEHESTPLISPLKQKIARLRHAGIEQCIIMPFRRIYRLKPDEFIRTVLIEPLVLKALITGVGFRFGTGAIGDESHLHRAATIHRFVYEAHDEVRDAHHDTRISSRRVRELLQAGDMKQAAALLGNPWEISGRVMRGAGRGHDLGVPTANVKIHPHIVHPRYGSYVAAIAIHDGHNDASLWHGGVVYWGTRPTFAERAPSLEAHIFAPHLPSLCGRDITVRLIEWISGDENAPSTTHLQQKMQQDITHAQAYFSLTGSPS